MEGFLGVTESRGARGYGDVSLATVCSEVGKRVWKVHPEQRKQLSDDVRLDCAEGGGEEQQDKRVERWVRLRQGGRSGPGEGSGSLF